MLNKPQQEQLSKFIQGITEVLDLTPTQVKDVKERYEAVGNWLDAENSPLHEYQPEIYPQGSFRLGTMIKPITDEEEYDIDLVCKLNNPPIGVTQEKLMEMVGKRLIGYAEKYGMKKPEEGNRCWTLEYADGTRFHMDILPAVPDPMRRILYEAVLEKHVYEHALRITCKGNGGYSYSTDVNYWNKSNPVGYAEWFKDSMRLTFGSLKRIALLEAKVEKVDDWEVKTPLQRAIQVLKRHRDLMFKGDENKPISIIITTLAARSYNEEEDVFAALESILERMPSHIEQKNDKTWIGNPVNPEENFADKWEFNSKLEENFYRWINRARIELSELAEQRGIHKIKEKFGDILGSGMVTEAFHKSAALASLRVEVNTLKFDQGTGYVGSVGTSIPKKDFHGKG